MSTIIVLTDFTASSRNALDYACSFLPASTNILLLNIYPTPFSYSGDGVALASIGDGWNQNQEELETELEWAHEKYPEHSIHYKEIMGELIPELEEEAADQNAVMVITGNPDKGNGTRFWEIDILNMLTDLSLPVMVIPKNVQYRPVKNIGFAFKPENITNLTPIYSIEKLVRFTGAKLHIVKVLTKNVDQSSMEQGETLLHEKLDTVDAMYHTVEADNIVAGITSFVQQYQIDILLIKPKKRGIWYRFFHKNHSRALAALDMIPVIALHEKTISFT
jgi:hypothetical protein